METRRWKKKITTREVNRQIKCIREQTATLKATEITSCLYRECRRLLFHEFRFNLRLKTIVHFLQCLMALAFTECSAVVYSAHYTLRCRHSVSTYRSQCYEYYSLRLAPLRQLSNVVLLTVNNLKHFKI